MQMMPATHENPKSAVHFGLLEFIHMLKLIAQVTIISCVKLPNWQNALTVRARTFAYVYTIQI